MEAAPEQTPAAPPAESPKPAAKEKAGSLTGLLVKIFIIPVLLAVFFFFSTAWLNSRVRTSLIDGVQGSTKLSPQERKEAVEFFTKADFNKFLDDDSPDGLKRKQWLESSGLAGNYRRLRWGKYLSSGLIVALIVGVLVMARLNQKAKRSQADLIQAYRTGWKFAVGLALINVLLLIPLMAYGSFEFMVLLMERYSVKLLFVIILGGLFVLVQSVKILLRRLPLEFHEEMAREVTPDQSPQLWAAVRGAAAKLNTAPPDRILVGMQFNFYVTELAVITNTGRVEGRTLYLSHPLMKHFAEDEVLAIIGHELGHFMGEDTRLTREFYPLRQKVGGTMFTMAQAGIVGWPSAQLLWFFVKSFAETEQAVSRARELLADKIGASLTSPAAIGRGLVKLHVLTEAFGRGLKKAAQQHQSPDTLNFNLRNLAREHVMPDATFWQELFKKEASHPMDSHPPLDARLASLGLRFTEAEAKTLAEAEVTSAASLWFSEGDGLFTEITKQAEARIETIRSQAEVVKVDPATETGRALLEKHFPAKQWRAKQGELWVFVGLLAVVALGCLTVIVLVDILPLRLIFGVAMLPMCWWTYVLWARHRHASLQLDSEGVNYSGWHRKLPFAGVESLTAQSNNGQLTLIFKLKAKQPPIWKLTLLPVPQSNVSFPLARLEGRQNENAEIIWRYFNRRLGTPEKES